ncbi:MAG: hypothetical protein ABIQ75_06630 [Flavobacteriales bacterium]
MPQLIGDIGGTRSSWALISSAEGDPRTLELPGFNPVTGDPSALQDALRQAHLGVEAKNGPLKIFAYGAGCGAKPRAERMRTALADVWPHAHIQVETDLLGAARGLYGNDAGLVLILGTGMNVGHYDGTFLHLPMPSLGYILGDEGSGADIGKHLLRDALYGVLPEPVKDRIFPKGLDLPEVLEATYRSPRPQAYLASHTALLAKHLDETYVHDLIAARFFSLTRLLARCFSAQELQQVRASGSVAFGFQQLLTEALEQRGIYLTAVVRDPLPGLVAYHAQATL